ncbi:hypothetical protein ACLQ25_21455 [Micromonospora sp. DT44]|uniref:hypothetical protein n=1 Tax=Micromonospora sp. DT44 TaxID=3393439 RepID=UPI003CE69216
MTAETPPLQFSHDVLGHPRVVCHDVRGLLTIGAGVVIDPCQEQVGHFFSKRLICFIVPFISEERFPQAAHGIIVQIHKPFSSFAQLSAIIEVFDHVFTRLVG